MKIRVFQTCVESVLLYAAETWSLTKTLTKRLDGAYTKLLRYALNISWKDKISNSVVYQGVTPISQRLREHRLAFAGHCLRASESAPQPVADFILWRYKGKVAKGAANRKTFIKLLCEDSGLPYNLKEIDASLVSIRKFMSDRCVWRRIVYSHAFN